nr:MAG TPA: rhamnogalacturan/acetylesterase-like protein [Caudoviricetes sp.]
MVKMHKLTNSGQTIYPATTTDAVVNPNTRKSLTAELAEIVNTTGKKLLQWVSFDAEKLIKPDGSISNMPNNKNYCVATYQVTSNSQVRICLNLKYKINGSCVFVLKKDDTIVYTQLAGESKVFQYEIYTGECNTLLVQMNSQANTLAYISETPPIIGLVNDQVIEDGSITTPKLANNSVTAEKLDESLYNNLVFKGENVVYDEILSNSIIKKDGLLDTSSQYYKNYRLFKYSVAQGTQYSFSTTLKSGVTPGGFGIVSLFKGDTFVKHAVLSSSSLTYNGDIAVDVDCDLAYILSDKDLVPNLTKSSSAIIEDGSITTPKLANNSVTAEKLDESITQEITNLIEFRKYQQGGYNVENTSGEYDRKMAETLYSIIQAQPTADIYVVDNYYGGYNNWSSPGRTYAQELKAMADWFSLGFISLKDAGIRERVDKEARVFTIDGLHAYTEIGAKRIYNRIMGQLLQRYNCDKSELTQKTFLLLGDSTSIIGEPTSWAKLLTEEFPGNVTVRAVAGTGWIDNNEGGGRNVLEQFNVDSVTQYDIIIITSGFNEYHHFQLDYAATIKYLSVYYNQLG